MRLRSRNKSKDLKKVIDILNPFQFQISKSGIVYKDPITNIYDKYKLIKDFNRDENKGIWIGRRALGQVIGIQSKLLEKFKKDFMHYAVKSDGIIYNLTATNLTAPIIINIYKPDDSDYEQVDNSFSWEYYDKSKLKQQQIIPLIIKLNNKQIIYSLTNQNCQYFTYSLAKYIQGEYDEKQFWRKLHK